MKLLEIVNQLLERKDETNVKEVNDIFDRFVIKFKSGEFTIDQHPSGDNYISVKVSIPKEDVKFKAVSDHIFINIQNISSIELKGHDIQNYKL